MGVDGIVEKGVVKFWQGSEAIVEGAIAAGCRFFAGYPITPASEIAEYMAKRLPEVGGIFMQMEDEMASVGAIIGASWAGAKAMTATSGPGFSLMQENIGLAIMTETPCVIVNVQRSGPSSGQATRPAQGDLLQARWGSHGDYEIIVLYPASVEEMFRLTIKAFNLAERFRSPVIILSDEILAHMRERIVVAEEIHVENRKRPFVEPSKFLPWRAEEDGVPPMAELGSGYRIMVETNTHDEMGRTNQTDALLHDRLIRRLCDKIAKHRQEITEIEEYGIEGAEIGVISCGSVARAAIAAVKQAQMQGLKVGHIRLISIWPFPDQELAKLIRNMRAIVVPEMNLGKLVREIGRVNEGRAKIFHLPKIGGSYHRPVEILDMIYKAVKES